MVRSRRAWHFAREGTRWAGPGQPATSPVRVTHVVLPTGIESFMCSALHPRQKAFAEVR
jgi:hypothetical protein